MNKKRKLALRFVLCNWRFLSIVFDLERTNQLNLLPDKDLVDLCPHIESYQVTKNQKAFCFVFAFIHHFL
ncbi:MAG: hypothetical protein EWV87_06385 [Microcystis panniformis Mp_GB_SS_20050300_S99]|nr:MAG: hypothetical protein EWV87_06385 [Microcystis panniformis Mp_GB_SS_20050300_S99]